MAITVEAASDTFVASMRNPARFGPGVCSTCWTFNDPSYDRCYRCGFGPDNLNVVVPITYAPRGDQMHTALRGYKDEPRQDTRQYHTVRLAAILWRFLDRHESCVAAAAGVDGFDLVATVPSKTKARDDNRRGLRTIVGRISRPTAERWERVLLPGDTPQEDRAYQPGRFTISRRLDGQNVLLIDDTWVTGASIQTAAADLRHAGAGVVAGVVIGRYLVPGFGGDWGTTGERWSDLPKTFSWATCAVHV